MAQLVLGMWGHVAAYGPVCLVDVAVSEHLVHAGEGFRSLGENDQSPYRTVKAMHDTAEHVAGFGVFLFKISLHYLSGEFVDHDYMVVLIYYPFGKWLHRLFRIICMGS